MKNIDQFKKTLTESFKELLSDSPKSIDNILKDSEKKTKEYIDAYFSNSLEMIPGKTKEESREMKPCASNSSLRSSLFPPILTGIRCLSSGRSGNKKPNRNGERLISQGWILGQQKT